ncbi:hypothetical protein [Oceanobacillus indicireducens]|uniref:Uncharacterized protein n=1 Tax=Oceanobacillus indicireducens TaxID=1004261 RepID=A0A917Y1I5_9BACI|nr:hypothetical protein [Oceanobacillus indicireducens]GGN61025.1 hypothetical protein GCM10007971_25670 [Oceanobacillus indicireducens]
MTCVRRSIYAGGTGRVCISSAPGTVGVQFYLEGNLIWYNWRIDLQRYENGRWTTIDTRYGYVSPDSPSHRSFTNIAHKNARTRAKIGIMNPDTIVQTIYSAEIIH